MDLPGQVWAVVIDGKRQQLWDLPIDELDAIAARHNVGSWLDAIAGPLHSLGLGFALVEACAKRLGVAVPLVGSARDLWTLFERVGEDLPAEWQDGLPLEEGPETPG